MDGTIVELYTRIKEGLTVERLKKISIDIINAYKNKNIKILRKYASIQEIDQNLSNIKLFSLLIKQYHPDRHSYVLSQAEEFFSNRDLVQLEKLHSKYFFDIDSITITSDYDIKFEAEYRYDKADFGYREKNIYDDDNFGETNLSFDEEMPGFIEAVNKFFFGGLDYTVSESDLRNLDGELDLSDYDICDLNGIEHCVNIESLNLSNNTIEKISKLSSLKNLKSLYLSSNLIEDIDPIAGLINVKELDISFNDISDISALENLSRLEFVNIIGNPIADYSVIDNLVQKGVMVVFEHTNLIF